MAHKYLYLQKKQLTSHDRQSLPHELRELFDTAAVRELGPHPEAIEDKKWLVREINQTIRQLETLWLRSQLKKTSSDPEKIKKLAQRLGQLEQQN